MFLCKQRFGFNHRGLIGINREKVTNLIENYLFFDLLVYESRIPIVHKNDPKSDSCLKSNLIISITTI